jgi:hypothetical protein
MASPCHGNFADYVRGMDRTVKSYYGNLSKLGIIDVRSVGAIVCTIEKANALINKLLEDGTFSKIISNVVVDELHMVPPSPPSPKCDSFFPIEGKSIRRKSILK